MLKVKQFVFNLFGECTYVVSDDATREAVVVDPGMASPAEQARFDEYVKKNRLKITGVVNTHLHLDHCFGANYVKDKYGVNVQAHVADAFLGNTVAEQALRFGMRVSGANVMIDAPLADGDHIQIGNDALEVIHTPGHSPGGICLYSPTGKFVLAGDTLFQGSIGRTDLPGGDMRTLVDSLRNKLFALPDDTLVLSGHGPSTTIGHEKATNPYA